MDNLLAYFAAHAPTPPLGLEDHIRARFDYAEAMLAEYDRRCPPQPYRKPATVEDVIREQAASMAATFSTEDKMHGFQMINKKENQ